MSGITLAVAVVLAGLAGFVAGRASVDVSLDSHGAVAGGGEPNELQTHAAKSSPRWVCPMHSEIVADSLQGCPICGMDLVKRDSDPSPAVRGGGGHAPVAIDPAVVHGMGVRTAVATRGELRPVVETVGRIIRVTPANRRAVTAPVAGRIVEMTPKGEGETVERGELLFAVFSDDLAELEAEFTRTYRAGDRGRAAALRQQLRKLGLTSAQIAELRAGGAPELPVEVLATEDGLVQQRRRRSGDEVVAGATVFSFGGGRQGVEVKADVFERQWAYVEVGRPASMTVRAFPGVVFRGRVIHVESQDDYMAREREVALRFDADEPRLSPGMFAHVRIERRIRQNVLMVPRDAVIRTAAGERVVRVRGDGRYQPVAVEAGESAGELVEILAGLEDGDQIVTSGQFLIDSESRLLSDLQRMTEPGTADRTSGHSH